MALQSTTYFNVSIHSLSARNLKISKDLAFDAYVDGNFDQFKRFRTQPMDHAKDPEWKFALSFMYKTVYAHRLSEKRFWLSVMRKSHLRGDRIVGECNVDLHTIATGPTKHQLLLRKKGQVRGVLSFVVNMEIVADVSLFLSNLSLSRTGPDMPYERSCVPQIIYEKDKGSSVLQLPPLKDAKRKTLGAVTSYEWALSSRFELAFKCTLRDFVDPGSWFKMSLVKTAKRGMLVRTQSTETVLDGRLPSLQFYEQRSAPGPFEVSFSPVSRSGESRKPSQASEVQWSMRGEWVLVGLPEMAQMKVGVNTDHGIRGGVMLAEGLPVPRGYPQASGAQLESQSVAGTSSITVLEDAGQGNVKEKKTSLLEHAGDGGLARPALPERTPSLPARPTEQPLETLKAAGKPELPDSPSKKSLQQLSTENKGAASSTTWTEKKVESDTSKPHVESTTGRVAGSSTSGSMVPSRPVRSGKEALGPDPLAPDIGEKGHGNYRKHSSKDGSVLSTSADKELPLDPLAAKTTSLLKPEVPELRKPLRLGTDAAAEYLTMPLPAMPAMVSSPMSVKSDAPWEVSTDHASDGEARHQRRASAPESAVAAAESTGFPVSMPTPYVPPPCVPPLGTWGLASAVCDVPVGPASTPGSSMAVHVGSSVSSGTVATLPCDTSNIRQPYDQFDPSPGSRYPSVAKPASAAATFGHGMPGKIRMPSPPPPGRRTSGSGRSCQVSPGSFERPGASPRLSDMALPGPGSPAELDLAYPASPPPLQAPPPSRCSLSPSGTPVPPRRGSESKYLAVPGSGPSIMVSPPEGSDTFGGLRKGTGDGQSPVLVTGRPVVSEAEARASAAERGSGQRVDALLAELEELLTSQKASRANAEEGMSRQRDEGSVTKSTEERRQQGLRESPPKEGRYQREAPETRVLSTPPSPARSPTADRDKKAHSLPPAAPTSPPPPPPPERSDTTKSSPTMLPAQVTFPKAIIPGHLAEQKVKPPDLPKHVIGRGSSYAEVKVKMPMPCCTEDDEGGRGKEE